jgi:hypothetical protein
MLLSKRDFTSLAVSSSVVAHAVTLVKSHMPDFDALIDSVFDTTQYFVSKYNFSVLAELDDNASPSA